MQNYFTRLFHQYFHSTSYCIEPVPFGLTNQTRILNVDGSNYVMRIYNKYTKDAESLRFEAQITSYLCNSGASFQVPEFLPARSGDDYIQFEDGRLGVVVTFLEGSPPDLSEREQAVDFGTVVGEISSILAEFDLSRTDCRGTPFTEIYSIHPLASREAIASFFRSPPFHLSKSQINFYRDMAAHVEQSVQKLKELPAQLVHHDVLAFNLLSRNGKISGVLDFDFASYDIAFMEFAISFNHILQVSNGSLSMAEAFIQGYARHCKASMEEIRHLLLLTRLYHIAVLHIYIGQYYAGSNIEINFNYILDQFMSRDNWFNEYDRIVKEMLVRYLI
ncbi:phosphotransferase [Paenibacillus pinihumi]|uniref:phosphotransferase n=1 Tax=Paenibacillus pinihumi TaxID=669462 RepID=UPI000426D8CB|nr:phosphotransferase [Paenibacillus pinihumi]